MTGYKIAPSLILICMLAFGFASAQTNVRFTGKVMEKSGEKIELVAIQLKELNLWTTSNNQGIFIFEKVPQGSYTLQAVCLGYEPFEKAVNIDSQSREYTVTMVQSSLALDEVVVTAKEHTSLSSSSKIESAALSHVQPTNLADVMQLVPGQITLNPDLSKSNQITIRDINRSSSSKTSAEPDDNSAMGTAIIVDGTPMSNNANMQSLNTSSGGTAQAYSTAGQGVDLRKIATDNIESVEVIRGIPSVQYGDLTTGAVLVKTKAGKTKLLAKAKSDPKIKQFSLSKGFLIPGKKGGALNVDVDYTDAMDDLRLPAKSYQRLTGALGYSNTFFKESKPLSFNVKTNYYSTLDDAKNDPDLLKQEILQEKEQNAGIKLFGTWWVQKPWLTNITYNFSGDYTKQRVYEHKVTTNSGVTSLPTAMVSGEAVGLFLPTIYTSDLTIDGQPYNFFGTIKANINKKFGHVDNKLMAGIDYRSSGNNGEGSIYDITRPPTGASTTRPRAFKDIPMSRDLALFVEDIIDVPIGKTNLKSQLGLRYNNMLPKGLFSTDGFMTLEPRLNITYNILNKEKSGLLKDLDLRFGFGKTSKNPSMIFMYPNKTYMDEMSFNYYPDLLVVTTKVLEDTSNPDLKPTTNTKLEAGIDLNIKGVKVMITGFSEKIINGFSYDKQYIVMNFNKWDQLAGAGKQPKYQDGKITYMENGITKTLPYSNKQEFHDYSSPRNNANIDKKGIEYSIDFGNIKRLKTNMMVDGAYYHIANISDVLPYYTKSGVSYLGEKFPYVSVMPGGKGSTRQRLNSNFKLTTHIPKIRMIVSLNTQVIWMESMAYEWKNNGANIAYSLTASNEKVYGNYSNVDKIYVDPIGYLDKQMQYRDWQSGNSFISPYSFMVSILDHDYFAKNNYPVTMQINLKLTKELGDKVLFSFFANNLFDQRPVVKLKSSDSYMRMNQTAYFGAELKLSL
jgi:outer membrane receptor protein involved in Fe transport